MTLEEALSGYDWIPDPWNDSQTRVAGPDNRTAIMVEEGEDGLTIWLRCSKTGSKLGTELHASDPSELQGAVQALYHLREEIGDCPLCESPVGVLHGVVQCSCGYSMVVEERVVV